ncbi:MAG: hypothetical protein QXP60_03270 [Nitrososphaerota archaeon]
MGYVSISKIKFIPEIKIEFSKDHKHKRGSLSIHLKNGSWSISYEAKDFTYFPPDIGDGASRWISIYLDITDESLRTIFAIDEKTGERYIKEIPDWLIRDYGTEFKIITHPKEEIENAEELIEPKLIKRVFPSYIKELEFYRNNKILKIPFFKDEIRINIENENLEYIRNDKKIIKAFPLNKEIHFYGIEPKVIRYIVTPEGARLASTR